MKSFEKKNLLLQAIFKFCTTKCLTNELLFANRHKVSFVGGQLFIRDQYDFQQKVLFGEFYILSRMDFWIVFFSLILP